MSTRAAGNGANAEGPIEREGGLHNHEGNAAGRDGALRRAIGGVLTEGSLAEVGRQDAIGEGFEGEEMSAEEWLASREWTEQDDDLDECRTAVLCENLDAYDLDKEDVVVPADGVTD